MDQKQSEKRGKSQSVSPQPQRTHDSDRDSVSSSRSERSDKNSSKSSKDKQEKAEVVQEPVVNKETVKEIPKENIAEVKEEPVEPEPDVTNAEAGAPPEEQADDQFDHLEKAAEDLVATWTAEVTHFTCFTVIIKRNRNA